MAAFLIMSCTVDQGLGRSCLLRELHILPLPRWFTFLARL